jgi:hypothetical protein
LESALRATGYIPKSAWAYNFRGISGAVCTCTRYGNCSLHGQGIAIDIDPSLNPYISTRTFSWAKTKFTATQIAAVEAIKNTKGEQIWFWGGRWITIKDYMHFEPAVDPGSTAVDWSTVPGGYGQGGDPMLGFTIGKLKEDSVGGPIGDPVGDQAQALQLALVKRGESLPQWGADRFAGDETRNALRSFQGKNGISSTHPEYTTGTIGPYTHASLYAVVGSASTGVTTAQLTKAVSDHAKVKAGGTVHPHGHDEGVTGPAI